MMPDGALALAAEETIEREGQAPDYVKSAIMSRRVTTPPKMAESARDASDAVAIVLSERGRIDLERIASLLGTNEAGAIAALSEGEKPRAFFDPETERWEPADLYLSGLVRRKLYAAEAVGLKNNIMALKEVIPAPKLGRLADNAQHWKHLDTRRGVPRFSEASGLFKHAPRHLFESHQRLQRLVRQGRRRPDGRPRPMRTPPVKSSRSSSIRRA